MPDSLQLFEWRDLVDIAVVAFIIYRLILLLKGGVAVRLLFVLASLALLLSFSRLAGLETFQWLLDSFFGSLVLILVLVFQSDIRRSLVTLGRSRPARGVDQDEASEVLDELVGAMTDLSSRRHGALVIVEREMGLMPYVQTGTEIDAKITSEILTSIFLPYSPIHDGAVIVRKGKLTRAGCFLPLSQNPNISKSLGTRHRAALGLTELTDAVALVVSEETGMMSVSSGGKLTPVADAGALRKLLRRLLERRWLT
ncbi:diadenylate cyclase CdaA [Geobacter pickeringii]|uniref:Diadenylate cyclase n=1 Tax=Geobacter pickeringii TaxID=345632 RepID=A0A0B5BDE8_9BACT|nr:diadenylate cyclase CdaA [Geobacter pickeringii]AJE03149.1 membrane protein [Geobacter pickeringii]